MAHTLSPIPSGSKPEVYRQLCLQLAAVLHGERDWICNLAQTSALLMHSLPDLNWAGFYRLKNGELVLGPFQGRVACTRIALGQGVCGTAAARRTSIVVPNVHVFPGHIACDDRSNAEIVVPLLRGTSLLGVLDLDSPILGRFDEEDARGLEAMAALMVEASDEP